MKTRTAPSCASIHPFWMPAALAAMLAGLSFAAGEKTAPAESPTGVALTVLPLQAQYYTDPRMQVDFKYRVTKPQDDGTVEVALFNVDSGERFTKTFTIPLSLGDHQHWAAWGGDKGPWTSSTDSELDLLLAGELASDDPVPDGYYIPQVTIKGRDGAVLAEQKHSSDEINFMRATGKISRKLSRDGVVAKADEIRKWLGELKALEAKARNAGADTSLPGLMITAMEKTVEMLPGHIGHLFYDLVIDNHAYCEKQVPRTRAQLQALLRDPASGRSIDIFPRPKERLSFKDGYFHDGDKPVFMMGQCLFALWPDLEQMRKMNFNLVHIGANPLCLFPDAGEDLAEASARSRVSMADPVGDFPGGDLLGGNGRETELAALLQSDDASTGKPQPAPSAPTLPPGEIVIPEPSGKLLVADYNDPDLTVRRFLDRCLELGIKVDLGLNMHPAPNWFFEQHPEARLRGYSVAGFIPFDIEHPASRALTERFLDAAMKEVANHPALNSIWLANEPTYYNIGPLSAALFRQAMRDKYETIEALNKALETEYADFEAIEPPSIGASSRVGVEYWWFNLNRLTEYFKFMQRCVRKYDKTVNTCFKLNNLQMGWYCPPQNVDQEGVTDISEIVGMDSGTYPFAKPYYDWLRSLSPEKPMVNLEFKGGGRRTQLDIWKAALSLGHAGIDWWCWHPKPTFSRAMCDTVALHEGSLAMYNIQRNFDVVRAFHNFPRSPFVVLYPDPVLPRAWHYFQAHTPTVNAIKYMGHAVDYATEKRIAAGRLDEMQYDIIVLPAANYIKDETFARVGAFVERGGKAVVVGDLPTLDPMGNPRDLGWLKAPADAKPALPDCTNGVVFAHGKGTVWILPKEEEKIIQSRLEAIAAQVLPPLPVVIQDEVEFRTIPWKNERGEAAYVTFILNEWSHGADRPIQADFRVPVREAVDLMTGEPVDVTRIAIPPLHARLIRWTPAE